MTNLRLPCIAASAFAALLALAPPARAQSFSPLIPVDGLTENVGRNLIALEYHGRAHAFYRNDSLMALSHLVTGPTGVIVLVETLDGIGGPNGRIAGDVAGGGIAAVIYNDHLHVFYTLAGGYVRHAELVEGSGESPGTWRMDTILGPTITDGDGTLGAHFDRVAGAVAFSDLQVFATDQGALWRVFIKPTGWAFDVVDGFGGPRGRVSATITPWVAAAPFEGHLEMFYVADDRTRGTSWLRRATWDGGAAVSSWSFEDLDGLGGPDGRVNAAILPRPAAAVFDGELHVFYPQGDVAVRHAIGNVGRFRFEVLDGVGSSAPGFPASLGQSLTATVFNRALHVAYGGDDGCFDSSGAIASDPIVRHASLSARVWSIDAAWPASSGSVCPGVPFGGENALVPLDVSGAKLVTLLLFSGSGDAFMGDHTEPNHAEPDSCPFALRLPEADTHRTGSLALLGDDFVSTCGGAGGPDAVFELDLTSPRRVRADTLGSTFDSVLYLSDGPVCPGKTLLACSNDVPDVFQSSFDRVLPAGTYWLILDATGPTGPADRYALNVTMTDPAIPVLFTAYGVEKTDPSWHVATGTNYRAIWFRRDFDESLPGEVWSAAAGEGTYGTNPWLAVRGFPAGSPAQWIWSYDSRASSDLHLERFRKTFVPAVSQATVLITADNRWTLWVNDQPMASGDDWTRPAAIPVMLRPGEPNLIAVAVENQGGPGGLLVDVR